MIAKLARAELREHHQLGVLYRTGFVNLHKHLLGQLLDRTDIRKAGDPENPHLLGGGQILVLFAVHHIIQVRSDVEGRCAGSPGHHMGPGGEIDVELHIHISGVLLACDAEYLVDDGLELPGFHPSHFYLPDPVLLEHFDGLPLGILQLLVNFWSYRAADILGAKQIHLVNGYSIAGHGQGRVGIGSHVDYVHMVFPLLHNYKNNL